jgi:excisionase family DNA binding protein
MNESSNERPNLSDRLALRPAEAAEALGVSIRTLRRLLPELPHIRRGGAVLFPVEPLRRWLEEEAKTEGRRTDRMAAEILGALSNNT